MTTSNTIDTTQIDYMNHGGELFPAMEAVMQVIRGRDIEPALAHLVMLRASQMNKCTFCVKMHTREAREDGETNHRLDHLIVWRHVDDFTPREKAAFAWTEALTELREDADYGALRAQLRSHFTEADIATLTAITAMINLWNRIQVSNY